jgi:hypothetical protein
MLRMPPHFQVPPTTPHLGELLGAFALYSSAPPGLWNPTPVSKDDYTYVCKYVDWYGDPVWEYLVPARTPRACLEQRVSLIEHERAELAYYLSKGHDPYARGPADAVYEVAHSRGLIVEHLYLRKLARAQGRPFPGSVN